MSCSEAKPTPEVVVAAHAGDRAGIDRRHITTTALDREIAAILPRLRRYAQKLTLDQGDADDLVQDCIACALEKAHLWKPGTDLRAWLFAILHNEHVDRVQHAARAGSKVEWDEHLPVMSCSSNQIEHMEFRELEAAVIRLPEDQREAVLLTSLTPWNYEEVATVCNVPVGTIGRGCRAVAWRCASLSPWSRCDTASRAIRPGSRSTVPRPPDHHSPSHSVTHWKPAKRAVKLPSAEYCSFTSSV
jgi:RNA polymerase sigma-70 factor, ECF subfamily